MPAWPAQVAGSLLESWPSALAAGLLLALSASFAAGETAFCLLTPHDLARLRPRGSGPGAAAASALAADVPRLLLTLLFGGLAANLAFFALVPRLARAAQARGLPGADWWYGAAALGLALALGDLLPKTAAVRWRAPLARWLAPLLWAVHRTLARPLSRLDGLARFAERAAGAPGGSPSSVAEDLRLLVRHTARDGALWPVERDVLERVLDFGGIRARDLMVHRLDALSVDAGSPAREAAALALATGRARLPVRCPAKDEWTGWVDARALALDPGVDGPVERWLRAPVFLSGLDRAEQALARLSRGGAALAFVVDERGDVTGLLTLAGLRSALLGFMEDDPPAHGAIREEDGAFILPGGASIRGWRGFFRAGGDWPECTTAGGLLAALLGRFPREGDGAAWRGVRLEAVRVARNRVLEVRLRPAAASARGPSAPAKGPP